VLEDVDIENSSILLLKSCEELRKEFLSLTTQRDVASLLEVSYERLAYHIYQVSDAEKYHVFKVQKKSGKLRYISAPSTALKIIQRKLSQVLYSVYRPNRAVHGFVPAQSIVTNAKQHARKRFVFNVDLKDFFSSIHYGRVRGVFMAPPYHLPAKVATVLAQICCFDNKLPQGAPTSPVVSNMVCARLDSQLKKLAKEMRCTYTRYADDITFSTTISRFPHDCCYINVSSDGGEFKSSVGNRLLRTIEDNGFKVNIEKTRLQHKTRHQEVTGLTVNQFPNVKRSFIREIDLMLRIWERDGLIESQKSFVKKRMKEVSPSEEIPFFAEVIRGKINFLGMVRGKDNKIYLKYLNKYKSLAKAEP